MQEKFACLFMSIASELWLRDAIDTIEEVFAHAARSFTLRLAETLSQYIYARLLGEQSLWLPQRRNACCMPRFGFVQFSPS